jgi:phosphoribosylaminoimidazolecarboxamide formyltransferase/IMP cyclohydrolase
MPRALVSVSDKTGLVEFARALASRGFELVSTGGTAAELGRAGLTVLAVSDVTGFPEMMDGRVKTLHPKIHGGILARRSDARHMSSAAEHGITLIDLVVVNLYPFAETAANPETAAETLIEQIDIGGPALVRAAAKNFDEVLVVVDPSDYAAVVEQLDAPDGLSRAFRFEFARKAFAHTAGYDAAIAGTLGEITVRGTTLVRGARGMPAHLMVDLRKVRDLRYGENPHQRAALYTGFGVHPGYVTLQGMDLSYTNLLDLDSAIGIVIQFSEPAAAFVKHANPCGVAIGSNAADAYLRAREADRLSAFGAAVALNRPIDVETARAVTATRIDAVAAPWVDEEARTVLAGRDAMRVVVPERHPATSLYDQDTDLEMRSIVGGLLVQNRDVVTEARAVWPTETLRVVTRRAPTSEEWEALRFAWRVCARVKSNCVVFTSSDRTLAIGAGQMSRVDAVNAARMKAGSIRADLLAGSVAASDAFIPFRDGLDAIAAAGARAVVQPGGSVRDQEVIAAADEHGLAMVFTGRRHFRH